VVVVVGGGEVVVVVFGWDVDCEFEDAEPSSLPDDACCVDGGCVVEVEVGGTTVVALGAGLVVAVPVVAAELEPGRSCATTTPMSAVKPVAAKAASRVRRLTRLWARSLAPGD